MEGGICEQPKVDWLFYPSKKVVRSLCTDPICLSRKEMMYLDFKVLKFQIKMFLIKKDPFLSWVITVVDIFFQKDYAARWYSKSSCFQCTLFIL